MNRLQSELQRLYLLEDSSAAGAAPTLINAQGQVRALVLELAHTVPWERIAGLWHQIQEDWNLPPPALAISGSDSFQLWFSLAVPVPLAQALAVLQSLRQRYASGLAPAQWRTWPTAQPQHAPLVPAQQQGSGHWSAFIVPGLGSMFTEEPWLERAPSPEAQADLLQLLHSVTPAAWQGLLQQAQATAAPVATTPQATTDAQCMGAYDFLHSVMNDPAAPLHLRIEAAKALLPYSSKPASPVSSAP